MLRLAEGKARAVFAAQVPVDSLIIAADTTVADGTDILGKPVDEQQAVEMLTRLRGHQHQVYTAVALLRAADGALLLDACVTDVPMRDYTPQEIAAYVATGDPLDKAGAYAIQHAGFHPVEHLEGCYANVVGLPLCHLRRSAAAAGDLTTGGCPRGLPGDAEVQLPSFYCHFGCDKNAIYKLRPGARRAYMLQKLQRHA